jgi:hypothetical protein
MATAPGSNERFFRCLMNLDCQIVWTRGRQRRCEPPDAKNLYTSGRLQGIPRARGMLKSLRGFHKREISPWLDGQTGNT